MAVKKNYVKANNKTYDVYFHQDLNGAIVYASFYEVKRPHRKYFGRTKFFPFASDFRWICDYDNFDELLMTIFDSEVAEREREAERDKKFEEFCKTP